MKTIGFRGTNYFQTHPNQHPQIDAEVTMPPPPQPTPVKPKAAAPTEKKVVKEDPLKAQRAAREGGLVVDFFSVGIDLRHTTIIL